MFNLKPLIITIFLAIVFLETPSYAIGVNLGSKFSHPLQPRGIAKLLSTNSITKLKLLDDTFKSLNSELANGTEVTIVIPMEKALNFSNPESLISWYKQYLETANTELNYRYLAIGNEASTAHDIETALRAIYNLKPIVEKSMLMKNIRYTIPFSSEICVSPTGLPSEGEFRQDIKKPMYQLLRFLNETSSGFMVNLQPYLYLNKNTSFNLESALFDSNSVQMNDNGINYFSLFDIMYDTFRSCLSKTGFGFLDINVGEVGWPTDSGKYASIENAEKFYKGFLKPERVFLSKSFLYTLIDEDNHENVSGNFETHWGLFRYDGSPKFSISFAENLNDDNRKPAGKNPTMITISSTFQPVNPYLMPLRWCVVDEAYVSTLETQERDEMLDFACKNGNCSSLEHGSSCDDLKELDKLSYALNSYYQTQDQDDHACDLHGFTKIVFDDPSHGNCQFPVQMLHSGTRNSGPDIICVVLAIILINYWRIL